MWAVPATLEPRCRQPTGGMPQKIHTKRGEQLADRIGKPADDLVAGVVPVEQALDGTRVRRLDDPVRHARDGVHAVEADQHPRGVQHGDPGAELMIGVEPIEFPVQHGWQGGAAEIVGPADRRERAEPEPRIGPVLERPAQAEPGRGALGEAGDQDRAAQGAAVAGDVGAGGAQHVQGRGGLRRHVHPRMQPRSGAQAQVVRIGDGEPGRGVGVGGTGLEANSRNLRKPVLPFSGGSLLVRIVRGGRGGTG